MLILARPESHTKNSLPKLEQLQLAVAMLQPISSRTHSLTHSLSLTHLHTYTRQCGQHEQHAGQLPGATRAAAGLGDGLILTACVLHLRDTCLLLDVSE
jgi:hypothetical protein